MTTKKKVIIAVCAVVVVLIVVFVVLLNLFLDGFGNVIPKYEKRESGDFVVLFYKDHCEISGTTEQGNEKDSLIVPEYIEGSEVTTFGVSLLLDISAPEIHSDALERIYFEAPIKLSKGPLEDCPNLEKIMYPEVIDLYRMRKTETYYPRMRYDAVYDENDSVQYANRANVSYYYNYEREDGEAYYWIDDYDYGGVIEFVPPAPEREGYEFGGWYAEPECVTAWDFESDTLPAEKTATNENGEEETVYQETILYAKWTAA